MACIRISMNSEIRGATAGYLLGNRRWTVYQTAYERVGSASAVWTYSSLASRASTAGLTTTKIRSLARKDIVNRYGLAAEEAAELKRCVARRPIEPRVVQALLDRSNHACCVCKSSGAIIIHHITEYEISQDNSYANLAVLCPNDHDRAHRSGLTLGLSEAQIRRAKTAWEIEVEIRNVQAAARSIQVCDDAIDYVNIKRIEEMCVRRLGGIPATTIRPSLRRKGILGPDDLFDEVYVRRTLSGGNYLFDYGSCREAEHYRQLLMKLSEEIIFEDLSEAARSGIWKLRALEGKYTHFIGGVSSKQPKMPIDARSRPLVFHHTIGRVRFIWDGDPKYLMSMSAISRQGRTNCYVIYGLVRTVHQKMPKALVEVTASPLLVAQPTVYMKLDTGDRISPQFERR